tara:strand:- start:112 stop:393 length:282 start_codon:yes stop_codon:yes gene_type:complete
VIRLTHRLKLSTGGLLIIALFEQAAKQLMPFCTASQNRNTLAGSAAESSADFYLIWISDLSPTPHLGIKGVAPPDMNHQAARRVPRFAGPDHR